MVVLSGSTVNCAAVETGRLPGGGGVVGRGGGSVGSGSGGGMGVVARTGGWWATQSLLRLGLV